MRTAKLPEVSEIIMGQSPPGDTYNETGNGLPFFQGKAEFGETSPKAKKWCNAPKKIAEAGDILMSVRAPVGPTNLASERCCIGRGLAAIRANSAVLDSEYLRFFLRHEEPRLAGMGQGSTFAAIGRAEIARIELPLPSLDEQRRIVDILSRAEGIVRLRREAQKKTAEIIPALFLDMFGDPATNPKGWQTKQLGELITDGPQNGLYKHASFYGEGTPILRIDSFYDGRVRSLQNLRRVRIAPEEQTKFCLHTKDIVINRVNSVEYLGKSAIVPFLDEDTVFESNMMRFSVDSEQCLPEYLIELLQTAHSKSHVLAKAKHAINQSSINQQDVRSLTVPIPPVVAQVEFTKHVESIHSIQSQQEFATQKTEATFNALLAGAFRADTCGSNNVAMEK